MDIISKIGNRLGLGSPVEPPRRLTGGFLHRMYSLSTGCGRFAVKLLNPHIMARPTAMDSFRRAEALETRLEAGNLPILPALTFGGRKMQEIGGQFFYVYDWFDGRSLRSEEICEAHCRTIGEALAQMHGIERREEGCDFEPMNIDWDFYIDRLWVAKPELGEMMRGHRALLSEGQARANEAFGRLPAVTAICHNDLDSKNVLWNRKGCKVIDLECLGWSSPYLELYETALCWSGIEECKIDPHRFGAFIRAYENAGGKLPADWTVVHDANAGRLGWLEYNLKRALGVDCSEEEVAVGEAEVRKTLAQLECCRKIRDIWT